MDASIHVQEILTGTCTLLSVCTCYKCATFTDLVASHYVQDRRPGCVVTGLFGPRNVQKNILPNASQHVEPLNTKWEKIIQSNTNWEEIIQSAQTVCQRFGMLPLFLSRELKDTGPISLFANHISGHPNEFSAVNLATLSQIWFNLLKFGLFWHYFDFFANAKNSQKKMTKDVAPRIRQVIQHI